MTRSHDIAITLGDPAGIGPEIVARTLAECETSLRARVRVIGDAAALAGGLPAGVRFDDRAMLSRVTPGAPDRETARAQVAYLEAAMVAARAGEIRGLVTAPINKEACASAGFTFPGHTEYLAQELDAPEVAMMFVGPELRVVLVTVHVGLAQVSERLSADLVARRTVMLARTLAADFAVDTPRVGVIGFNPHAGEGGMFGDEEARAILPGIERARRELGDTAVIEGPLVPDAVFRAARAGHYDGLVAMYHDQALIPIKLLDFDRTVNVTLGLPIVRTSPDHGTAYDIAGHGVARHESFAAALALAVRLVDRRARTGP